MRCCVAIRAFVKIARGRSDPDGRCPDKRPGRGKSELRRALRWVTPSPGDGKESATENRPPGREASPSVAVRVKRWGKSPPAPRVTGAARQTPQGARPNRGALTGGPPASSRVGRLAPGPGTVDAAPFGCRGGRRSRGSGTPPARVTARVEE